MRWSICLVTALALCLGGCPRQGVGPAASMNPADLPGPAQDTFEMFQAAGDRAILVLKVLPDRWPAMARTLRPYFSSLPIPPAFADKILLAPDLPAALAALVGLSGGPADWPREMPGWDPGRPLVAALFEAGTGARSLASQLTGEETAPGLPGMRHRVLIPASDSRVLLGTLAGLIGRLDVKPEPRAADFPGLKGGLLFPFPDWRGFFALIPEKRWLRIELVTHQMHAGGYRPADDVKESLLAGWRTLLDQNPAAHGLPLTPALHFAATSDSMFLGYLRPWKFREVSNQMGARLVMEAVAHVDPAMRAMLMAMGFAEVNTGTLLMTPLGAEMDDLALGLSFDGGLRFRGVASLTELGERMYRAGLQGSLSPVRRTDIPVLARASLRLDTNAMLQNAQVPEFLQDAKSPHELFEPFQECGYFCPLHGLLRNPVGILKRLRSFARYDLVEHLPRSIEVALVEVNPQHPTRPVKLALAAGMPAGYDPSSLKQGLDGLDLMMHSGGKLKTQLVIRPVGDQQVVLIGLNIHPEEVFGVGQEPAAAEQVTQVHFDLAGLSSIFSQTDPAAMQIMKQIDTVDGSSRLSGRALLGELSFGTHDPAVKLRPFSAYHEFRWASPGLKEAQSEGARCLNRLVAGQIQAFKAIASTAADQKAVLLTQALQELAQPLDCALSEPSTRQAASDILLMTVFLQDSMYRGRFQREQHLSALSSACAKGVAWACAREKDVRAEPEAKLIDLPLQCERPPASAPDRLVVPVSPQDQKPFKVPAYPAKAGLLVEPGVAWSRVAAALKQQQDKHLSAIEVVVRDSAGRPAGLPALLPGPADKVIKNFIGLGDWLVIKLSGAEIELAWSGESRKVPARDGALDLEHFRQALDATSGIQFVRTYLDATPETGFVDLATALAVLTCGGGDPDPSVVLGPSPALYGNQAVPATTEPAVMGALDKNIIRRVIRRHIQKIKYCYEKELAKDPKLTGTILVRFTISPEGTVIMAKAQQDTMKNPQVTQCLLAQVRKMVFPKPKGGGIAVVNYPFIFKSSN